MVEKQIGPVKFIAHWPWEAIGLLLGLDFGGKYFAVHLLLVGFEIDW